MTAEWRQECYRCRKPKVTCVCDRVEPVANRTEVVIIQHPREARHPFGTVRFAKLGLERVRVVVPEVLYDPVQVDLPERVGLLFPSPEAKELGSEPLDALVVLDGTWPQARSLYRFNPWLAGIPHYGLVPSMPSTYRIRKEPDERFLSTIEAIASALVRIEPETAGIPELLGSFQSMVRDQLDYAGTPRPRKRVKRRRKITRIELDEDLVLAHAEIMNTTSGRSQIMYLAACQPSSGRTLSVFARPEGALPPDTRLEYAGLSKADVEAGLQREALAQVWQAFLRNSPCVVWNQSTVDALGGLSPESEPAMMLKAQYCNLMRHTSGSLAEVVARHELVLGPVGHPGRVGRVMAELEAVVAYLRDYEGGSAPVCDASRPIG